MLLVVGRSKFWGCFRESTKGWGAQAPLDVRRNTFDPKNTVAANLRWCGTHGAQRWRSVSRIHDLTPADEGTTWVVFGVALHSAMLFSAVASLPLLLPLLPEQGTPGFPGYRNFLLPAIF